MSLRRLSAACLLAAAAFWSGCGDAPRSNPLDPLGDGFRDEGAVEGRVTGPYPPFPGRASVQVRLIPVGAAGRPELATRTDAAGQFALAGVPAGPYAVTAEAEGFMGNADTVTVAAGQQAEALLVLDALPVVTAQRVRSVHILRWPPLDPVFQLEVEATAEDPDRPQDLTGASLVVPDLGFAAPLDEVEPGRFAATFGEAELPAPGIETLLGRTLRIEVRDAFGAVAQGPPQSLVRIIDLAPQPQSPQWPDAVSPSPTLTWRPAQPPFAFTYRVDVSVVNGAGIPNLVARYDDLDAGRTSLDVDEVLAPGDYFWTLWVVDAFGNRSRSREAGFRVL